MSYRLVRQRSIELAFVLLAAGGVAFGQPTPGSTGASKPSATYLEDLRKADAQVIRTAEQGRSQEVFVGLNIAAELAKQRERRREKLRRAGPAASDEDKSAIEREMMQSEVEDFAAVKERVFPQKALGRVTVKEDFPNLGIVVATVPDYPSLLDLVAHPLVRSVKSIRSPKKLGGNNLQLVGQPQTIAAGKLGNNTTVAIIDDGLINYSIGAYSKTGSAPSCRYSWQDLSQGDPFGTGNCKIRDMVEWDPAGNAKVIGEYYGSTGRGHGDSVATVVARFAPRATLSILRGVSGRGEDVFRALQWVLTNRDRSPRIVAVNMSMSEFATNSQGSEYTPIYPSNCAIPEYSLYTDLFEQLIDANILPIVGSGNDGSRTGVSAPACVPGAVAVSAVADEAVPAQAYGMTYGGNCSSPALAADNVPCFANLGPRVSLLAPGVDFAMVSGTGSGTSVAAPHVSAAVALLRGDNAYSSDSTAAQTLRRLTETGAMRRDQRNASSSAVYPRLQVNAAAGLTVWSVTIGLPEVAPNRALQIQPQGRNHNGDWLQQIAPSSGTWSISDPTVATVNSTGLVRGLRLGTATLTFRWQDKVATTTLTVRNRNTCTNPAGCPF